MKRTENKKHELLRTNSPFKKFAESVLRPEESLWWERFVKKIGFGQGMKERESYEW